MEPKSLTFRIGELAMTAWRGISEATFGRMAQWTWITVLILLLLFSISSELVGPVLKVLAKMTLGASLGYWIDRTAFPRGRPHEPLDQAIQVMDDPSKDHLVRVYFDLAARYMLRRAVVVAACVVGATMGL